MLNKVGAKIQPGYADFKRIQDDAYKYNACIHVGVLIPTKLSEQPHLARMLQIISGLTALMSLVKSTKAI